MDWVYYIVLLVALVAGLALIIFNLPGLWLMAGAAGLYALVTSGEYIGWGKLAIVLALCLLAELLELLARAGGAKQAGGSKRSMILATIGGVLGGILLSLPVPILGTIAGVCIGAFAGAMIGQMTVESSDLTHSAQVGYGAAKGTLIGMVLKLAVGIVLFIFAAIVALPFGGRSQPLPSTTAPATAPTTQAQ
jgi:uncharacterized protein YqgC (DUF456 family)